VAIHGFREELLERQAEMTGLPLWKVDLPFPCTNEEYEARMAVVCERAVREGFEGVAFGDLFLEEIRAYRVAKLAGTGLEPVFPVWGIPTDVLAAEMMADGLRARLTSVDPRKVPAEFAGREWDQALLRELPEGVDPCGENGEFHSFAGMGLFMRRCRSEFEDGSRVPPLLQPVMALMSKSLSKNAPTWVRPGDQSGNRSCCEWVYH
jgi:diphthamide synthase (EF-2-diphthine--ammonia ligase)